MYLINYKGLLHRVLFIVKNQDQGNQNLVRRLPPVHFSIENSLVPGRKIR